MAEKHAKDPATYTVDRERLIADIADALYRANPGWNTAPARREIAGLMLDAMPSHVMRLEDGTWTRAVGEYVHDCDMDTLNRVSTELMQRRRPVAADQGRSGNSENGDDVIDPPTFALSWTQGRPDDPPPWIDLTFPNGVVVRYRRG